MAINYQRGERTAFLWRNSILEEYIYRENSTPYYHVVAWPVVTTALIHIKIERFPLG